MAPQPRIAGATTVATEVTDEFVRDVNNRRVELQAERTRVEEQMAAFEDEVREAVNPELLDCLLIAGVDLDLLPDEVSRPLFEALRLEIHYDYETRTAVCRIPDRRHGPSSRKGRNRGGRGPTEATLCSW
jgi:hypothetical protein